MASVTTPTSEQDELLDRVRDLTPHEFEYFVATLWELQGWTTTVTAKSGDEGVDVIATKLFPFELKIRIEAKLYDEGNKVGGPTMRKYALPQGADADCAALVTSSSFTTQAISIARTTNTKLIDGEQLARLIQDLGAEELLSRFVAADNVRRVHTEKHVSNATPNDGVDPRVTDLATGISGIHAGHAERLARIGIETIADLAAASPESVAEETEFPETRLQRWVNHATYLEEHSPKKLDGIGPKKTNRLAAENIETLGDLAIADPTAIADATGHSRQFGVSLRDRAAARPGLPTDEIEGIGSKLSEELAKEGIDTVADLAAADPDELAPAVEGMGKAFLEKRIEKA